MEIMVSEAIASQMKKGWGKVECRRTLFCRCTLKEVVQDQLRDAHNVLGVNLEQSEALIPDKTVRTRMIRPLSGKAKIADHQ
jgi:hypothetical protein